MTSYAQFSIRYTNDRDVYFHHPVSRHGNRILELGRKQLSTGNGLVAITMSFPTSSTIGVVMASVNYEEKNN